MMHNSADKVKYIVNDLLIPFKVGISLKSDMPNNGDMSYNYPENEENRLRFFKDLKIEDKRFIRNRQIHSDIIVYPNYNSVQNADGLISKDFKDALMLLTADCYNIFFTTDNERIFGAVHAGWKGVVGGILNSMKRKFKGESKVLIAQGICGEHFIVKEDVASQFAERFSKSRIHRENNIKIDIRSIINDELNGCAEIANLNMCNVCNKEQLFSYRENDIKYRNLSLIWRENE
jgi:hypothetical protein